MTTVQRGLAAIVGATLAAIPQLAHAQQTCAPGPVARLESVKNSVQLVPASTRAPILAARQLPICAGDTIQVGDNSRAVVLMLASNTPLVIDQNSEFVITESPAGDGTFVDLVRGALLFITRVRRSIEIRTPFVNAAIEGTEFVVRVQADRTVITVFEGIVLATNPQGTVSVGAGQQAVAVQGQAPQLQVIVRPRDAVQWALYYEPVLPMDSFAQLATIPEAGRDAMFYVRRAGLLLGAGQLDEARADLDQAQKLDPANGNAHALRAIVSVALNDKAGALDSGRMAVEQSPQSPSARLALSYALQANIQLEAARDAATQATEIAPTDAGAWARLAELRLMLDDVGGAVEAARRAASLSPQVARAQSALGFALLAQLKTSDARAAFERAIDVEPDNPLARLGLGLTRIRQGRLAEGRGDLELAMAMNPDNSLIRSYLGKAYFEEKRDPLAWEQLDIAKTFDPYDPTPLLYGAIQKQVLNRPIEALRDLHRSAQLNDNRAVYRSRLLLDQDLAVRATRLGRIYRDLGFEQLALLEASKSLTLDSSNYSAHRLLADNYLTLSRHEIARDSELLQAQLLQPVNFSPVQPRLADNGLLFLGETGTSGIGFNEYTQLFAANRLRFVGDGIAGSQSTKADNLILSGNSGRMSFSIGHSYFATDGLRVNNYTKQRVNHAFFQADVAPKTRAQLEVRIGGADTGDRRLLFDPTVIRARERNLSDNSSARLGLRRDLAPGSVLLVSYMHRSLNVDYTDGDGFVDFTRDEAADLIEIRFLKGVRRLNISAGAGYYIGDGSEQTTIRRQQSDPVNIDVNHANAYVYTGLNLGQGLSVMGGVSVDDLNGSLADRKQVNPKLGLSWNLNRRTTVRTAVFRALQRTLVSSQTLEPTQVVGFSQFFFDAEGAQSWRYAIGIDSSLSDRWYLGAEFSIRDLSVPIGTALVHPENHFGRAYVYLPLTNHLALSVDYQRERLIREPGDFKDFVAKSTTHRMSPEVRLFHPSGVFGRFKATYVDQQGKFWSQRFVLMPGADRFWTVDASMGYRLRDQLGIAIDVRNIFDQTFKFQDSYPEDSRQLPKRLMVVRLTLGL